MKRRTRKKKKLGKGGGMGRYLSLFACKTTRCGGKASQRR